MRLRPQAAVSASVAAEAAGLLSVSGRSGWRGMIRDRSPAVTGAASRSGQASRLDTFVVGKPLRSDSLGVYIVTQTVSNFALSELIQPLSRAVHPGFAKVSGDRERL
ncbi:MAG: hypothetical protein FJX57_19665, partial [Alphaproteobacteria bacterium]|nr:hypothetical protein [Alphaproteobacteria bacterium]